MFVRNTWFSVAMLIGLSVGAQIAAFDQSQAAQDTPSGNHSAPGAAAPALSRELELEEQLQVMKDQRNYALDKNQALELQVQQLQAVVSQVLDNMRAERVKDAADSRASVSRKLVAAMKGDPDKGDRWDWERRGLLRADGTFVSLVKPEDAKEKK